MISKADLKAPFITVEGVDGAGKTTQLKVIIEEMEKAGWKVFKIRQPGGTPVGAKLREILLNSPEEMSSTTELLMAYADRDAALKEILAALQRGEAVVCDRHSDSSYAYQVKAGKAPATLFRALEAEVCQGISPHATFFYDLPVAQSFERMRRDETRGQQFDNMERRSAEFFEAVRAGFLERAKYEPARIRVVDASGTLEEVAAKTRSLVQAFNADWNHRIDIAKPKNRRSSP